MKGTKDLLWNAPLSSWDISNSPNKAFFPWRRCWPKSEESEQHTLNQFESRWRCGNCDGPLTSIWFEESKWIEIWDICSIGAKQPKCMCEVSSCALMIIPASVIGCDFYAWQKTVCSPKEDFGLNITSKQLCLPLFPTPVASLQTWKLLSFRACCVTIGSLLHSTYGRIWHFSSRLFCCWMFACVSISIKQVLVERTTPTYEVIQQEITTVFLYKCFLEDSWWLKKNWHYFMFILLILRRIKLKV